MDNFTEINISNFNFKTVLNNFKAFAFVVFCYVSVFTIFDKQTEGISLKLMLFLIIMAIIGSIYLIVLLTTKYIINSSGVTISNYFKSKYIRWDEIKYVKNQLISVGNVVNNLNDDEGNFDYFTGKKEIIFSSLEDYDNETSFMRIKNTFRIPFIKEIYLIFKNKEFV